MGLSSHPSDEELRARCSTETCSLRPLSPSLYLWTMASMLQASLLAHFVSHYVGLGVRATHMKFVLHRGEAGAATAREADAALRRLGVVHVTTVATYHTVIKRDLVNLHILSLPPDSWLLYADVDELFQFPCPVVQRVLAAAGGAGAVVCGHMVDRLPDRRVLPPIEAGRPLHAQFPVCAPVRMALNSALGSGVQHSQWNLRKVMLVRVGPAVQFKSSHTLMKGGPVCSQDLLGYIDHYSFDAASAALSRQKLAAYDRALGGLNKRGQQSEQELVELVTSMNARSQYRDLITLLYNVSAPAEEPQLSRHAWGLIQEARVCCPLQPRMLAR
mmetsp:Transcript_29974/g.91230  ORF Transcript_29974/g.91230 Transcript_29974/m.91230 type:complete len:330 (-) Transcript_29974:9-998(-)